MILIKIKRRVVFPILEINGRISVVNPKAIAPQIPIVAHNSVYLLAETDNMENLSTVRCSTLASSII